MIREIGRLKARRQAARAAAAARAAQDAQAAQEAQAAQIRVAQAARAARDAQDAAPPPATSPEPPTSAPAPAGSVLPAAPAGAAPPLAPPVSDFDMADLLNAPYRPSMWGAMGGLRGLFGRLGGAFGGKYPTIQIFARDGTWDIIQLRNFTGPLVLVKIRGTIYPIHIDGRKLKTYRYKGVPMAQTILYAFEDMFPFDPSDVSRAVAELTKSGYPPLAPEAALAIIAAGRALQADKDATSVTVESILRKMSVKKDISADVARIVQALGRDKIAEPTPDLVDFLTGRMLMDPSIITAGLTAIGKERTQWVQIANPAKGPFRHWMLVIGMVGGIAALGILVGLGVTQGWFDGLDTSGSGLEELFELAGQFDSPAAAGLDVAPPPAAPAAPATPTPPLPAEVPAAPAAPAVPAVPAAPAAPAVPAQPAPAPTDAAPVLPADPTDFAAAAGDVVNPTDSTTAAVTGAADPVSRLGTVVSGTLEGLAP